MLYDEDHRNLVSFIKKLSHVKKQQNISLTGKLCGKRFPRCRRQIYLLFNRCMMYN